MSASYGESPFGLVRRLIDSVSGLLATAISIGRTRLELLGIELREELHRTAAFLLWSLVSLLAAASGLLFAGLTIVFAFWDTHRILAAAMVTVAFFSLAIAAAILVRTRLASKPSLLQATLAELARDEEQLRGQSR